MPPAPDRTISARIRLLHRFGCAESGATAVEFGIVAFPFIFLLFAILQVAMVFWAGQVLDTAVALASRQIYTGQYQQAQASANVTDTATLKANFKQKVCDNMPALYVKTSCTDSIDVDVRNYSASGFSSATPPTAINPATKAYDTTGYSYQNIGTRDIALVTASMVFPSFVKFLPSQSGLASGDYLIVSTAAFRAEPY